MASAPATPLSPATGETQISPFSSSDDFFHRHQLGPPARLECETYVAAHYPEQPAAPCPTQGYCSFTFVVGDDLIIQFRPAKYRLDLTITTAAKDVYASFAPATEFLTTLPVSGLLAYRMERLRGRSYKDFLLFPDSSPALSNTATFRPTLCEDLAVFLSRSWRQRRKVHLPAGQIGSTLDLRLRKLSAQLPARFQPSVTSVRAQLPRMAAAPWVLTHGDIMPSNIMLDAATGHLTGLVDWAEAEPLPFGMCLYGLDEILGCMTADGRRLRFVYHSDAASSRSAFLRKLRQEIPSVECDEALGLLDAARVLGILLRHGFAFDDGAIDRVVQDGDPRDELEIAYLDALLGTAGSESEPTESLIEPWVATSVSDCRREVIDGLAMPSNASF